MAPSLVVVYVTVISSTEFATLVVYLVESAWNAGFRVASSLRLSALSVATSDGISVASKFLSDLLSPGATVTDWASPKE